MGRHKQNLSTDLSYIAGFLDGDGSIMFQLKRRGDTKRGKRLMFTVCLYQDSRHEKPLFWFQKVLKIGYISRRKDGMTELRINGYESVERILRMLYPYLKFKKEQVDYLFRALDILGKKRIKDMTVVEKRKITDVLMKVRRLSYQSGQKKLEKLERDLKDILEL